MPTIFCGQCNKKFTSEQLQLNHICEVTGVKPTEPESMGASWDNIQTSALDRGKDYTTDKKLLQAKQSIVDRLALSKSALKENISIKNTGSEAKK